MSAARPPADSNLNAQAPQSAAQPAPRDPRSGLPSGWQRLSPLLDELLDLPEPARAERLAALGAQDAALAAQLAALLAQDAALAQAGFLDKPALPGLAALQQAGAWLAAGLAVGPYTLLRLLGEGGMGSVWLAQRSDGRYDAQVAIKFLHSGLLAAGQAERFAQEGAILARLAHPHIARLLDAGVTQGERQPYLVLEYVAGETMDRWCDAQGLGVQARVRLMLDVLDAVAHAHNRLILHRDLKPSNILVTAEGRAMLLDFGIAKLLDGAADAGLTQRAGSAYTLHYAAPEQLQGGEVTTATDVYALGVMLYGLLGGGHPTNADTAGPVQRLHNVLQTVPRKLSDAVRAQHAGTEAAGPARRIELARQLGTLRGDLDTIVAQALKKAPEQRYANAAALAEDLRRWLAHQPIIARPDSRLYVAAKFLRRQRAAVALASLTTLLLLLAVAGALSEGREARRQRDQAESLIEFMLGDLRRKLQPVGRLDVLDAVGERVLAHYAVDGLDKLDADALGRRARALQLLGELSETRGQLDAAALRIDEAARSTALLLARAPHDGQRLFDHAQSVYWLGYIARRRGQGAQAQQQFDHYVVLAERLVALDAQRRDWQLERAYALYNQGVVRLEAGHARDALAAFQRARPVLEADAAQHPASFNELADVLGAMAMAHSALGDNAAARRVLQAKVAALQRHPALASDAPAQRLLTGAWRELAMLAINQGPAGLGEASQALAQAQQGSQRLVALDADNLDWQALSLLVRLGLAELAEQRGDADQARLQQAQAQAVLQRLLSAATSKLYWRVTLQGMVLRQGWSLGLVGADQLQAFLASLPRAAGVVLDEGQRRLQAELLLRLGDALAAQGQPELAQAQWRAADSGLAEFAQRGDFRAKCLRAQALAALGQLQPARQLADEVEASDFRHPVYAALRRRLAVPH